MVLRVFFLATSIVVRHDLDHRRIATARGMKEVLIALLGGMKRFLDDGRLLSPKPSEFQCFFAKYFVVGPGHGIGSAGCTLIFLHNICWLSIVDRPLRERSLMK